MSDEIYTSMIQHRGFPYRDDQLADQTHDSDPIDHAPGRLAGNSRIVGDASPEVQSRVIDALIASSEKAGLTPHETAYVLAIARKESGFNPDAAAGTTSAYGLGQTVDRTAAAYGITDANKDNLEMQSDVLVAMYKDNAKLAADRGQGEEYIYKYHHDGPAHNSGGLDISKKDVVGHIPAIETFVEEHQKKYGVTPPGPSLAVKVAPEGHHHGAAHAHGASLEQGAKGDQVGSLQESLKKLGYQDAHGHDLVADKDFGPGTKAAVEKFQADHGLKVDGKVGAKTLDAIQKQSEQAPTATPTKLSDANHPDHALYQQARTAVGKLDAEQGRPSGPHSDNISAALTVAARKDGLTQIDRAVLSEDASKIFAVQGHGNTPFKQYAGVETVQAVNTPVEHSTLQWSQMQQMQTQQAAQQQVTQQNTQQHGTPQSPTMQR